MRTLPAAQVEVGMTIQHPKRYWPARPVLGIERRDTAIRFIIPSTVKPGETTGVVFPFSGTVIIHEQVQA